MKQLLFFSLLLLTFSSFEKKGDAKVLITGKVMHTGVHCGGVELSPAEMDWIHTPKPFAKQKIYVKKGKVNDLKAKPVLDFVSGEDGSFSINLPSGDYCFIGEGKTKAAYNDILKNYAEATKDRSAVDKNCLDKWFALPDAVLTIEHEGVANFELLFADQCPWNKVPCTLYNGPLPP